MNTKYIVANGKNEIVGKPASAAATARKLQNLGAVDGSWRGFTTKSVEELVEKYENVEAVVGTTSYVVYAAAQE